MFKNIINKIYEVDCLLSLRGVLALSVFLYHINYYFNGGRFFPENPTDLNIFNYLFTTINGQGAVVIFFMLSGYLLGKNFFKSKYSIKNYWSFIKNRILRIFPLYYFAILLFITFKYTHFLLFENSRYLLEVLFFFYSPKVGYPDFVSPLWSLSVEFQFYLILPIIMFFLVKIVKNKLTTILSLFLFLVFGFLIRYNSDSIFNYFGMGDEVFYHTLFYNLDVFIVGALVYPVLIKFNSLRKIVSKIGFFAFLLIPFVYLMLNLNPFLLNLNPYQQAINYLLTIIFGGVFIFIAEAVSFEKFLKPNYSIKLKSLIKNPFLMFNFLGTISFGVYIWHFPIISGFWFIFQNSILSSNDLLTKLHFLLISLFITILWSTIIYNFIEKPFLNKKV